jgi:hypothetical protein
VNGKLGSDSGKSFASLSSTDANLCAAGTVANFTATSSGWTWGCAGANGGTTDNTGVAYIVTNGACGASNGAALTSAPASGLCITGPASAVTGSGPWSWSCAGSNGGTTASCAASKAVTAVNGVCGAASGVAVSSAPSTGLCSTGTASALTGAGPWSWACAGSSGGTSAQCSAPLAGATCPFASTAAAHGISNDGCAGATPGAALQLPNLLKAYGSARPPFDVAGVDYAVGASPNTAFKVPTATNLPAGASLVQGSGWTAIYVDGNNVTLDGYDLTGLTVMINSGATGTVTINNCIATTTVNIRSTVDAQASLVVRHSTLNGGGAAADPNYQVIQVWMPTILEYSLVEHGPGAIQVGAGKTSTIRYNVLQGFGEGGVTGHCNAIYTNGGNNIDISFNTIYSEAGPTPENPDLTGLGAALGLFGYTANYTNASVDHNTIVAAFDSSASYLLGFYMWSPYTATGTVNGNYIASVNGFNGVGSGAIGTFHEVAPGVTYTGNVDMVTNKIINGDNSESPIP